LILIGHLHVYNFRMSGSAESGGKVVYDNINVMEKFSALLRTDFIGIAEKNRSLGFLNESMSDVLTNLAVHQFPKAHELLDLVIASLARVEYARKIMYHRTHLLGENAFQSTLAQTHGVKNVLQEREQARNRLAQVTAARARSARPNQVIESRFSADTGSFRSANTQAVQATSLYATQFHRDVLVALTSFAHAQMEMQARIMEIWGGALEQMDEIEVDEDNDVAASALLGAMDMIAPPLDD
jgi:hypothetical protein